MKPLLEGGHWRSAILDSGAFTVYAAQMKGKEVPTITVEAYGAFAAENAHLFDWVTNLDDIGGDVEVSNRNQAYLEGLGLRVVPVWHEGESREQLDHCIARARAGAGWIALGGQRPKGSLVPTNVVRFLGLVMPYLAANAPDLKVHGFGLTRYATSGCPGGAGPFKFDSVDSTTWIAEGCALHRSGATHHRHAAFRATVDSYRDVAWVAHREPTYRHGEGFDLAAAKLAGGQARTVALRHEA
jgi:hypothetical protein